MARVLLGADKGNVKCPNKKLSAMSIVKIDKYLSDKEKNKLQVHKKRSIIMPYTIVRNKEMLNHETEGC